MEILKKTIFGTNKKHFLKAARLCGKLTSNTPRGVAAAAAGAERRQGCRAACPRPLQLPSCRVPAHTSAAAAAHRVQLKER